jgi:hypothetical protein
MWRALFSVPLPASGGSPHRECSFEAIHGELKFAAAR